VSGGGAKAANPPNTPGHAQTITPMPARVTERKTQAARTRTANPVKTNAMIAQPIAAADSANPAIPSRGETMESFISGELHFELR
jgi:hypothetical protein